MIAQELVLRHPEQVDQRRVETIAGVIWLPEVARLLPVSFSSAMASAPAAQPGHLLGST